MRTRTSLKRRFGKAFTLIELLIVITIIGILAVALIPRVTQGPVKARDVKRKSDVQNIGTAMELYYSDLANYPGAANDDGCATELETDLADFTQAVSTDPKATDWTTLGCASTGYYYKNLEDSSFVLVAKLEQESTGDNVYCNLTNLVAATTYDDALTALNASTCVAPISDVYYYVVLR